MYRTMTNELWRMIHGAVVALQPVVFLIFGVYSGAAYGGIVDAVLSARSERLERESGPTGAGRARLIYGLAVARS
jgi:hypothetical protein